MPRRRLWCFLGRALVPSADGQVLRRLRIRGRSHDGSTCRTQSLIKGLSVNGFISTAGAAALNLRGICRRGAPRSATHRHSSTRCTDARIETMKDGLIKSPEEFARERRRERQEPNEFRHERAGGVDGSGPSSISHARSSRSPQPRQYFRSRCQFDENFTFNDRALGLEFVDKERLREFFEKSRQLFPDTAVEVITVYEVGDTAFSEWRLTATWPTYYVSVPLQLPISLRGASIAKIQNGRIRYWSALRREVFLAPHSGSGRDYPELMACGIGDSRCLLTLLLARSSQGLYITYH